MENGEPNFRNWLFGGEVDIIDKLVDINCFRRLRDEVIKNRINKVSLYYANNLKESYKNICVSDQYEAHNYIFDDIFLCNSLLYLVYNGIFQLYYDSDREVFFVSKTNNAKNISSMKLKPRKYEYIRGNIISKDTEIFTFSFNKEIKFEHLIKDLLDYPIK